MKETILDSLLGSSISYVEAEAEAEKHKALTTAKEALMKEVQIEAWDELQSVIPEFADIDVLGKFKLQKGKPLPNGFKVSCL